MFSLSLLTTLWLRFAARQENTSEPAYPRGPPDAQVFGLDRVSQINIDLMRSGPASHCHSELSGTALTLTSENTTTGSRRAAMEEDGMSTLAKHIPFQLNPLTTFRHCYSMAQ